MRPKQWVKNVLVFAGIVFDRKLLDGEALAGVLFAFCALILVSGSVYIINDLVDIEKDRLHPKKRARPLPSGKLPKNLAFFAAIFIPLMTIIAATAFNMGLGIVLLAYLGIQVMYSFYLKHMVILDVLTVTSGFVLRVIAGVLVINVENFSPWLYACVGLLALFIAVGKRRGELVTLGQEHAMQTRPIFKDYNLPLLDSMLQLVTTGTLIVYIIYTIEADTAILGDVNVSMLTVPFVLYALFRYLYLIYVREEGSAPDEVLLQDRPLQIAILLWGVLYMLLLYVVPVK